MRQTPSGFLRPLLSLVIFVVLVAGIACSFGARSDARPDTQSNPWMPKKPASGANSGSETLGTVAGNFQVDQNGAANYAMGLTTPPGTAGMSPALSLGYNSHAGNSVLGQGWSLGGISFIQRCAVTRDGVGYPVTYTSADRFCLDGQLLVAVTGVYGQSGTVYATELQSWRKVVSNGSCGSGPCSFTVTTKDGRMISSFGATEDSRAEAVESCTEGNCTIPAGSVRAWGLNQVLDPYVI